MIFFFKKGRKERIGWGEGGGGGTNTKCKFYIHPKNRTFLWDKTKSLLASVSNRLERKIFGKIK